MAERFCDANRRRIGGHVLPTVLANHQVNVERQPLTPRQRAVEIVRQKLVDFLAGHRQPFSRTHPGADRVAFRRQGAARLVRAAKRAPNSLDAPALGKVTDFVGAVPILDPLRPECKSGMGP